MPLSCRGLGPPPFPRPGGGLFSCRRKLGARAQNSPLHRGEITGEFDELLRKVCQPCRRGPCPPWTPSSDVPLLGLSGRTNLARHRSSPPVVGFFLNSAKGDLGKRQLICTPISRRLLYSRSCQTQLVSGSSKALRIPEVISPGSLTAGRRSAASVWNCSSMPFQVSNMWP